MKGILRENKVKKEINEPKSSSKLRSQTIIQHPLIDTMTRNLHPLSNHKNRKRNAISFLQQCKQFLLKLSHWMLIYLDNLLHFILQPVVPLPSKSMIALSSSSSSTSFVLQPSKTSTLSLSSMRQQQRFVIHSRHMDIRRKRNTTMNYNNKKCSYITKTKSIAALAKYNRPSERIVYLPIMKTSTICPNNYSTKQFVIECFTRK